MGNVTNIVITKVVLDMTSPIKEIKVTTNKGNVTFSLTEQGGKNKGTWEMSIVFGSVTGELTEVIFEDKHNMVKFFKLLEKHAATKPYFGKGKDFDETKVKVLYRDFSAKNGLTDAPTRPTWREVYKVYMEKTFFKECEPIDIYIDYLKQNGEVKASTAEKVEDLLKSHLWYLLYHRKCSTLTAKLDDVKAYVDEMESRSTSYSALLFKVKDYYVRIEEILHDESKRILNKHLENKKENGPSLLVEGKQVALLYRKAKQTAEIGAYLIEHVKDMNVQHTVRITPKDNVKEIAAHLFKELEDVKEERDALSADSNELDRRRVLIREITTKRNLLIFAFIRRFGCEKAELKNLMMNDIDFKDRTITFRMQQTTRERQSDGSFKTGSAEVSRAVKINHSLFRFLQTYIKEANLISGYVFGSIDKKSTEIVLTEPSEIMFNRALQKLDRSEDVKKKARATAKITPSDLKFTWVEHQIIKHRINSVAKAGKKGLGTGHSVRRLIALHKSKFEQKTVKN